MKVYDCFLFDNEKLMLELRLNELKDVVDYFVICEGNAMHSGGDKVLVMREMIKEQDPIIKPFMDRIVYVEADLRSVPGTWEKEFHQRNVITENIISLVDDNDLVMMSDLDEVPKPSLIKKHKASLKNYPYLVYRQYFFYYNFKWMKKEQCHGTSAATGAIMKATTMQNMRDRRTIDQCVFSAGWHCSYFGTPEEISHKIQAISHTEFSKKKFYDPDRIKKRIKGGIDIFDRGGDFDELIPVPENLELPQYALDNRDKFSSYFGT
jgi:beta-1,4-mannosyl-glycoprotein beta-1,4-N-acetylglucosaminyltransferase